MLPPWWNSVVDGTLPLRLWFSWVATFWHLLKILLPPYCTTSTHSYFIMKNQTCGGLNFSNLKA